MFKAVLFAIILCREKLLESDVVLLSSKMVIVVCVVFTYYIWIILFYAAMPLASENNNYSLVSWLVNWCWKLVFVFYAQSLLLFLPQIWPWLQSCSVRFTRNKRFFLANGARWVSNLLDMVLGSIHSILHVQCLIKRICYLKFHTNCIDLALPRGGNVIPFGW